MNKDFGHHGDCQKQRVFRKAIEDGSDTVLRTCISGKRAGTSLRQIFSLPPANRNRRLLNFE
jgi:hypothetical protein